MKQLNLKRHIPHIIVKDTRKENGWVRAVIAGHSVEAKVYDQPSEYGINEGRVSKLCIAKDAAAKFGLSDAIYNYDRGEDINKISAKKLRDIVEVLEQLPVGA